jgi:hypothetical protein
MTPELYALGLRARAAKRFRWVEGMAAGAPSWRDDARINEVDYGKLDRPPLLWVYRWSLRSTENGEEWDEGAVPALDDDATVGCLDALVCEAWGDSGAHLVRFHTHHQPSGPGTDLLPAVWWALAFGDSDEPRCFDRPDGSRYFLAGPSRACALVAALEAAP